MRNTCTFDSSTEDDFCGKSAIGYITSYLANGELHWNGKAAWIFEACEEHFVNVELDELSKETKHRFSERV